MYEKVDITGMADLFSFIGAILAVKPSHADALVTVVFFSIFNTLFTLFKTASCTGLAVIRTLYSTCFITI